MRLNLQRCVYTLILSFTAVTAFTQCQFAIVRDIADDHCLYGEEEVVWRNMVNVTAPANTVTKSGGVGWAFDAGAISVNTVSNNGWMTMSVGSENTTTRIFGISAAATISATPSTSRTQFGFYLYNGAFYITESGSLNTYPGAYNDYSYRSGDVLKIAIENNVVRYYQNDVLVTTSTKTPVLPMVVDADLYSDLSTIRNVKVFNSSNGKFIATASNPGTSPLYQWYLGSTLVGTGATYTNTALTSSSGILTCVMTPGVGGCTPSSGTTQTSNPVRFSTRSAASLFTFNTLNAATSYGCYSATEPVVFTNHVNIASSGNTLTKNGGNGFSFDAGAFSVNKVLNNGYIEAVPKQSNAGIVFGLSAVDGGVAFGTVQFAFYLRNDGAVQIYESNSAVGPNLGTYTSTMRFKIEVDNGVIKYYVNDALKFISSKVPTLPLYADVLIRESNAQLLNAFITNATTGSFTAQTSMPGTQNFQWRKNAVDLPGVTTSSGVISPLAVNDLISCTITSDRIGCSAVTTAETTIKSIPFKGTSYIRANPTDIACSETEEEVTFTDIVNSSVSANAVTKFQGSDGASDAGATSMNQILNNGYAAVTVDRTDTYRAFGISSNARTETHSISDRNRIQYGFVFRADGFFEIWEVDAVSGTYTYRNVILTYAVNDVFKLRIDNGFVRYYQNDNLRYSSAINSALLPMVIDLSMMTLSPVPAKLEKVVVSNGSSGLFESISTQMGTSPTYQWKVNGVNSGTNASTYINSSLAKGDAVTCVITPDIPGCSVTGYPTNIVRLKNPGGDALSATTWNGSVSTAWSDAANWSNGSPKGYSKVTIPAGRPRNPVVDYNNASVYDLVVDPGAAFSISGSNSFYVYNKWSNKGTLNANTSTVTFRTCTNNTNELITQSAETFNKLVVDNVNNINVSGQHTIANQMQLIKGVLKYSGSSDLITFDDNAIVTGASNASHVDGKVRKRGNDVFTFPIGKNGIYREISMSNPASFLEEVTAEYFFGNAKPLYGTATDPSFWTVTGCEYWTMLRSASSPMDVTLSWNADTHCPTPDTYITIPSELRVTYWNGSMWADAGNGATTGSAGTGTILSNKAITAYNVFTIASLTANNPLPIVMTDFTASNTSLGTELEWLTLSEANSDKFIIQRAGKNLAFENIDSVNAQGHSVVSRKYKYLDLYPQEGKNYYRLKFLDADGTSTYSDVVMTEFDNELPLTFYPNPVRRGEELNFSKPLQNVNVINPVSGVIVETFDNERSYNTGKLVPGIYLLSDQKGVFSRFIVH